MYWVDWIMMWFFKNGSFEWFYYTCWIALSCIKECQGTIITSTNHNFAHLMIEFHAAKWRRPKKSFLWEIWIMEIPNIWFSWHIMWHLLESQACISDTSSKLCSLHIPRDTCSSSLESIWVLHDHTGLKTDALRKIFCLLTSKILFEHINLIVLFNSFSDCFTHFFGGLSET